MLLQLRLVALGAALCAPPDTTTSVVYGHLYVTPADAIPRSYLDDFLTKLSAPLIGAPVVVPTLQLLDAIVITATAKRIPDRRISDRRRPGPRLVAFWPGRPELLSEFEFTLHRSGVVSTVTSTTSGDSAVAPRVTHALAGVRGDSLTPSAPDSLRLRLRLGVAPDSSAAASQPLLEISEVGPKATFVSFKPGNPPPRYPDRERSNEIQAIVLMWLDVDENGRPVHGSFGAARSRPEDLSSYQPFVESMRDASRSFRFNPATAGGCNVRQRIVIPVSFRIGG